MKFKIKESSLSSMVDWLKQNIEKPDSYIFLSTKEMMDQIKINFETFCPKLNPNILINCIVEKVPKQFEHPIIILSLEKKWASYDDLKNFVNIEEKILPIVLIHNSYDYDNKH